MRQPKRKVKKSGLGFSEDAATYSPGSPSSGSSQQSVELGAGGRLVIPAPMRAALGIKVGDRLIVRLEADELRVHTYLTGIRRVQDWVQKLDPENKFSADEFIAERRREAAREAKEFGDE